MAKQLTAPGCKYSIVARIPTTIYSPDQKWTLDVPAGQTDFIAETNEIIIPVDAMLCRMKRQIDADLARVNVLGTGSGSLATFVTRAIEQIVGKGNVSVAYGGGKVIVALALDTSDEQIDEVESLLQRLLPKDVVADIAWADGFPVNYTRLEYLESTGTQWMITDFVPNNESGVMARYINNAGNSRHAVVTAEQVDGVRHGISVATIRVSSTTTCVWGVQKDPTDVRASTTAIIEGNTNYLNDRRICWRNYETNYTRTAFIGQMYPDPLPYEPTVPFHFCKNLWYSSGVNFNGKLLEAKFSQGDQDACIFVPALDDTGTPCMYDIIARKAFKNAGTGQFIVGMTTEQVLNLTNLPATGGSLTVSLPLETAFDDNVKCALETATAKGWTITVQYRESDLTTENIEADFLEGTGTQYIDTRIVPNDTTGLRLTALTTSDTDTIPFGSRTSNETESRFYAVRPRRLRTGTIARLIANGFGWGGWVIIGENLIQGVPKKEETYLNWLNARSAISEYAAKYLLPLPFTPELSMYLFAANIDNTAQLYYIGRIWAASVSIGTQLKANFIPVIDSAGIPCMHDTVSGQNFYNQGEGQFTVGFDTTEKAAISLSKLPVTTDGTLTVSLPAEAEDTATLVPAAIDIAKSRGWTIITQYRTN